MICKIKDNSTNIITILLIIIIISIIIIIRVKYVFGPSSFSEIWN